MSGLFLLPNSLPLLATPVALPPFQPHYLSSPCPPLQIPSLLPAPSLPLSPHCSLLSPSALWSHAVQGLVGAGRLAAQRAQGAQGGLAGRNWQLVETGCRGCRTLVVSCRGSPLARGTSSQSPEGSHFLDG